MDPREAISIDDLDGFLHDRDQHLDISIELVRRLTPDSLSLSSSRTKPTSRSSRRGSGSHYPVNKFSEIWSRSGPCGDRPLREL